MPYRNGARVLVILFFLLLLSIKLVYAETPTGRVEIQALLDEENASEKSHCFVQMIGSPLRYLQPNKQACFGELPAGRYYAIVCFSDMSAEKVGIGRAFFNVEPGTTTTISVTITLITPEEAEAINDDIMKGGIWKVDLKHPPQLSTILDIASRFKASSYSSLETTEKPFAEVCLTNKRNEPQGQYARSLSTIAVSLASLRQGKNVSILLASEAVLKSPDDAAALANLGALLRAMGFLDDAMTVLTYSYGVDPDSVHVLANLAGCAHEIGDISTAVMLLQKSIDKFPDRGDLSAMMGDILLDEGNWKGAMECYWTAAKASYSQSIRDGYRTAAVNKVSDDGEEIDNPWPDWADLTSGMTEEGNISSLKIPAFPKAYEEYSDWYANLTNLEALPGLIRIKADGYPSPSKQRQCLPGEVSFEKNIFQLECLTRHYRAKVAAEEERYEKDKNTIYKHHKEVYEKELAAMGQNVVYLQLNASSEAACAATTRYNATSIAYSNQTFERLWLAAEGSYIRRADLMKEYWRYAERIIKTIYNQEDMGIADGIRMRFVCEIIADGIGLACDSFDCHPHQLVWSCSPQTESKRSLRPVELTDFDAVISDSGPCPGPPLKLGGSYLELQIDCKSISASVLLGSTTDLGAFEYQTGVKIGATYNFKKHYVSALKLTGAAKGKAAGVGAGAETGLQLNLGPNGEIVDVVPVFEVGPELARLSGGIELYSGELTVGLGVD